MNNTSVWEFLGATREHEPLIRGLRGVGDALASWHSKPGRMSDVEERRREEKTRYGDEHGQGPHPWPREGGAGHLSRSKMELLSIG